MVGLSEIRLNLGCGRQKLPDWINCDNNPLVKPDELFNLLLYWPFADNTVDRMRADNIFEHIGWGPSNEDQLMAVMNEAHRVLKPGGVLWWKSPDAEKWPKGALRDPTHRRGIVDTSADYWNHSHQTYRNYGKFYGYKPWTIKVKRTYGPKGTEQVFLEFTQKPVK